MFKFGNTTIDIVLPQNLSDDLVLQSLNNGTTKGKTHLALKIFAEADGTFQLTFTNHMPQTGLRRGELLLRLLSVLENLEQPNCFSASAVALNQRAAMIIGYGKTMLAAWLIERGFSYVADTTASFGQIIHGLASPLKINAQAAPYLAQLKNFGSAPVAKIGEDFYIGPKAAWQNADPMSCGMFIFLDNQAGAELTIEEVSAADAAIFLNRNKKSRDVNFAELFPLILETPAIKLIYSDFEQLDGIMDKLLHLALHKKLTPEALQKFLTPKPKPKAPAPQPEPVIIPRKNVPTHADGVSVIMPAYNSAKYLAEAIESVLAQTHENWELLIANDGSTDATADIAESFVKRDKRIKVFHQTNQGEPVASNLCIAKGKFDFYAKLDSDDRAMPDRFQLQVNYLKENPQIAILGGAVEIIDIDGKSKGLRQYPLTAEACHQAMLDGKHSPLHNPATMIRRAVFEKIGGFRPQFRYISDVDFWVRLDEHFKMANLPETMMKYRHHVSNMSTLKDFEVRLGVQIANLSGLARKAGLVDPITETTLINLDTLAKLLRSNPQGPNIFNKLLEAALANYQLTHDPALLNSANQCLLMGSTTHIHA
jgi:Glycosyl transferase family 2